MPIDVDKALGAELPASTFTWSEEDVILYNLGVGAGNPPTEARELRYTYEGDLAAIPSFGTIPPFRAAMSLTAVDGFEIDYTQLLHGEQELIVHREIPTSGEVSQTGSVVDIFDKVRGALVVLETVSVLGETGEKLFTNRYSVYVRGEGGFGGEKGPPAADNPPERHPDHVVESSTIPQQALLYRMASGDKNPLHADPDIAALAGFERPILHGLCTYGIVAKAVVDHALEADPTRLRRHRARFTGHVFPGETLRTRIWDVDDHHIVTTHVLERDTRVISNARVEAR